MITDQEARKAVDYLRDSAQPYAEAKARQAKAEAMMRHTKALAMKASSEDAAAKQERDAYASEEYKAAIVEIFEAVYEAEHAKAMREAASAKMEYWRSWKAAQRHAEKGFGAGG